MIVLSDSGARVPPLGNTLSSLKPAHGDRGQLVQHLERQLPLPPIDW